MPSGPSSALGYALSLELKERLASVQAITVAEGARYVRPGPAAGPAFTWRGRTRRT